MVPILVGVIVGCAVAAAFGMSDPHSVARIQSAPWIGLPPFQTPVFSWGALVTVAPIFIVLVAENKGHIAAISSYMAGISIRISGVRISAMPWPHWLPLRVAARHKPPMRKTWESWQ